MGVVFQSFELLPTLTVLQNVMLPMDFAWRYSRWEQRKRAMSLLEQVDIADHAKKLPDSIIGRTTTATRNCARHGKRPGYPRR